MSNIEREFFQLDVFNRDSHRCVWCGRTDNLVAHHLIERRLWPDGGYVSDNGVTLCPACHYDAERTDINVEDLRYKAGIKRRILPPQLEIDAIYDKWGNEILPNGQRVRGELMSDESVQAILHGHLYLFSRYVKHPRIKHLPWSNPGADDLIHSTMNAFENRNIVVTRKMDGEITTLYNDFIHARSVTSQPHPSQSWIRRLHGEISWQIPENMRVCGENLYATHSIHYENLPSYFLVHSIWDGMVCLGWDQTREWCELLGLQPVETLYRSSFRNFMDEREEMDALLIGGREQNEGYVLRVDEPIAYSLFTTLTGKWVRKGHVTTDSHWRYRAIVPNTLREGVH